MYFAFDNSLGEKRRAMLYANILQYNKENQILLRNYKTIMERFALKQKAIVKIRIKIGSHFFSVPEISAACNTVFSCNIECLLPHHRHCSSNLFNSKLKLITCYFRTDPTNSLRSERFPILLMKYWGCVSYRHQMLMT